MLESILLVTSLCIDAGLASFSYGTNKIKIPIISALILTLISTIFLLISITFGVYIKDLLPTPITKFICFGILFVLGLLRLFEELIKQYLDKKAEQSSIELNLLSFKLVLNVYADATVADIDHSKTLTWNESLYLGVALSLDSLVVGFGAALASIQFVQITLFSIIFNLLSISLGSILGHNCASKSSNNLSWLSGALLIILSLFKLI